MGVDRQHLARASVPGVHSKQTAQLPIIDIMRAHAPRYVLGRRGNESNGERAAMEDESQAGEQSWYCVKATYKAVNPGRPRRRHLWERNVFLIRAPRSDEIDPHPMALLRAEEVARGKEHEYEVEGGKVCRWVFQQIEAVLQLGEVELEDGVEVYWEMFERVDKTEPIPNS
jgi:hypothetical protein